MQCYQTFSNREHAHRFSIMWGVISFICLFLSFSPTNSTGTYFAIGLRLLSFVALSSIVFFVYGRRLRIKVTDLAYLVLFTAYLLLINVSDMTFLVAITAVMLWSAVVIVAASNISSEFRMGVKLACDWLIYIWVLALAIQVIMYYGGGIVIHFHNIIFPWSEARFHVGSSYTRLTGTQVEPGTYSNWIYGVVFMRAWLMRRISTKLNGIAIVSMLFTLSAWAYFAAPLFMLGALLEQGNLKRLMKAIFILGVTLSILLAFLWSMVVPYLLGRLGGDGVSIESKSSVYNYFIHHVSEWILCGQPMSRVPCVSCLAPQDAGVGINFVFYFGVMGILMLGFIARRVYWQKGMAGVLVMLPLLGAKFFVLDPVTMLIAALVLQLNFGVNRLGFNRLFESAKSSNEYPYCVEGLAGCGEQ